MTRQTYRSILEELQAENMELRRQIRDLKKQLETQIYDNRRLDEIIEGYREEKTALSMPSTKKTDKLSPQASDFMSQYRKYRQLKNEEEKKTEIEVDSSKLEALMKKFKPA